MNDLPPNVHAPKIKQHIIQAVHKFSTDTMTYVRTTESVEVEDPVTLQ